MNSQDWLNRALKVIPGGSQTYSKSYRYYTQPFYASHGKGGYLYDIEGTEYHDFNMALGAVILGYKSLSFWDRNHGIYSWPHTIETLLAEKITEIIPSAKMVKFFKNGSDATEIAVRLARGYTGKDVCLVGSYHGFHDWYVSSIPNRNNGILKEVKKFTLQFKTLRELKSLMRQYRNKIACVVVEPDMEEIETISKEVKNNNIILIFDEVLTGFRHSINGLQSLIDIIPDISTFGKCMANGLPLSMVVGRKDIMELMEKNVFASSTFGGDTLALSVAMKVIDKLSSQGIKIGLKGLRWKEAVELLIEKKDLNDIITMKGMPARCGLVFNQIEYQTLYQQELLSRQIIVNGLNNFCLAHTDKQIDYYIKCCDEVLDIIVEARKDKNIKRYLKHGTIQSMFRR